MVLTSKMYIVFPFLFFVTIVGILVGGFHHQAFAQDEGENPYVELYKLRVSQAEANVQRQAALETLAQAKLARGRILLTRAAIAREEFDTLTSEAGVAAADKVLSEKKVEESRAYLKIIQSLVARGVAIPLCTYETE